MTLPLDAVYRRSDRMVGRQIAEEHVLVPIVGSGAELDAIFTLNQDLLLDRHYLNDNINRQQSQKWNGWQIPA